MTLGVKGASDLNMSAGPRSPRLGPNSVAQPKLETQFRLRSPSLRPNSDCARLAVAADGVDDRIRAAFDAAATGKSSLGETATLTAALEALGVHMGTRSLDEILKAYDADGSGGIGVEELARLAGREGAWHAARPQCNPYLNTLHAINSAIVKSSKLTKATKVYRGVAGLKLPATFIRPNSHGVRGGVENGFMSTTLERSVAMSYAAGGALGLVFSIEQGMVDRGADISWLSQYPHEQEVRSALAKRPPRATERYA